jgi:16S rRNA processing protein RimM
VQPFTYSFISFSRFKRSWTLSSLVSGEQKPYVRRRKKNKYEDLSHSGDVDPPPNYKLLLQKFSRGLHGDEKKKEAQSVEELFPAEFPCSNDSVSSLDFPELFHIGFILSSHGVRGDVRVKLSVNRSDISLTKNQTVFLKHSGFPLPRPIRLTYAHEHKDEVFLFRFQNVRTRNEADLLRKCQVYIPAFHRKPLIEGEYFIDDMISATCYAWKDENSENSRKVRDDLPLGIVIGVVESKELVTPGTKLTKMMHPLIEVRKRGSYEVFLVPFVSSLVKEIDLQNKRVYLDLPQGYEDLSYPDESQ